MKVVLVICPSWDIDSPPYNLALLKAILKKEGIDCTCLDFNFDFFNSLTNEPEKESWKSMSKGTCWYSSEFSSMLIKKYSSFVQEYIKKIIEINSDVIGFTLNQRNRFFSYEIIKKIKEKVVHKPIILGGPTCFRDDVGVRVLYESCADAVCMGEGERSFVEYLKIAEKKGRVDFCPGFAIKNKKGEIVDCGNAEIIEDLNMLPFADFSDFDTKNYLVKKLTLLTSRGCIRKCSFCAETHKMNKFRSRSGESIYKEVFFHLNRYPFIEEFEFADSLINGDISILDKFCDLVLQNDLKFRWKGQAVIRKEMVSGFLKKLGKTNCETLSYGVESGSDKILERMKKGYNAELAEEVLRNTFEAGIGINFNIIIGFPGEGEVEFQKTVEFVERNLKYANTVTLNILSVDKTSELHEENKKYGICFPDKEEMDWYTEDGANTMIKRIERLKILQGIVKEKSSVDLYKEISLDLKLGDKFLSLGQNDRALEYYYKAKKNATDENILSIVEAKISLIKT